MYVAVKSDAADGGSAVSGDDAEPARLGGLLLVGGGLEGAKGQFAELVWAGVEVRVAVADDEGKLSVFGNGVR